MVTQLKALRVDVIFDQYFTPSIKDYEHSPRSESAQLDYIITSPDQKVPSINEELSCPEHEEADTKIIFHICNYNFEANIVIRTVDTDIAAIMLAHLHRLKNDSTIWMLTGTGNNVRYVNLTKIHAQLGESICRSLPGFHAITGCDYNPALFRKGKLRPYKLLKKNDEFQKAFIKFGENKLIEDSSEQKNIFNSIQKYICSVYNVRNAIDVNSARVQMFIDSYKVSDINEAFNRKKLRNFDASSLPPCENELLQHFLRANYICTIWNNAHLRKPTSHKPENNGWVLENDQYHFKWFEGDQLPTYVSDSLQTLSEADEDDDIHEDKSAEWSSDDEDNRDTDEDDEVD
ncbi:uncharacterized protein LOC129244318 [Anastrepha obliqua]|uniref:uncharacterized protein LOC129244318 n=1 Tax=Anastrepha obliqua TaxID=95512 RepID=UPI0024095535|nr:uncharacterized protein LOC129244318 [Anastrepha obliqua]